MNPPEDRHPFVLAVLQQAVRELLKDKHGHRSPQEIVRCPACTARFWECLGRVAPKGVIQG